VPLERRLPRLVLASQPAFNDFRTPPPGASERQGVVESAVRKQGADLIWIVRVPLARHEDHAWTVARTDEDVVRLGGRTGEKRITYPRSELALRYGAGVETETSVPAGGEGAVSEVAAGAAGKLGRPALGLAGKRRRV
jgi:hypothetical protein